MNGCGRRCGNGLKNTNKMLRECMDGKRCVLVVKGCCLNVGRTDGCEKGMKSGNKWNYMEGRILGWKVCVMRETNACVFFSSFDCRRDPEESNQYLRLTKRKLHIHTKFHFPLQRREEIGRKMWP